MCASQPNARYHAPRYPFSTSGLHARSGPKCSARESRRRTARYPSAIEGVVLTACGDPTQAQASHLRSVSPSALFPPSHRWVWQSPSLSRSDLVAGSILGGWTPPSVSSRKHLVREPVSPKGPPCRVFTPGKSPGRCPSRASWSWGKSNPRGDSSVVPGQGAASQVRVGFRMSVVDRE